MTIIQPPDFPRVQYVGVALSLIPGRDAITARPWPGSSEVQRAPDSGGAPGTWVTIGDNLPPLPAAGAPFVDQRPATSDRWHYRWRHKGAGFGDGAWSGSVSALPALIPKDVLVAAVNNAVSVYPILRGEPLTDGKYALRASESDGSTKVSDALNGQGSLLPFASPNAAAFFNYQQGGPGTGQKWISFGWSAQTLYRPDGTSVTVPVAPTEPNLPTLSSVAGGALGARTRWAKVAYVKTDPITGIEALYPVSANNSFAVPANELLKVTAPANPGGGLYDGWVVLVGSASGSEYVQGVPAKINFGTDWTEPAGGFSTTQNSLWAAAWQKITKVGLATSTQYWHYPYYSIGLNLVVVPSVAATRNPQLAAVQNGDAALSLGPYDATVGYSGAISIFTSAAAGTSSGAVGGGRLT